MKWFRRKCENSEVTKQDDCKTSAAVDEHQPRGASLGFSIMPSWLATSPDGESNNIRRAKNHELFPYWLPDTAYPSTLIGQLA